MHVLQPTRRRNLQICRMKAKTYTVFDIVKRPCFLFGCMHRPIESILKTSTVD